MIYQGVQPPDYRWQEFWIVVTDFDSDPKKATEDNPAKGPLVWEGHLMTEGQAFARAEQLADSKYNYGNVRMIRVSPTPDNTLILRQIKQSGVKPC